ncbi:hypothetical protein [Catenulispora subtropica]|uniref:Secreted protein n=1 Tax=Catenulispora subtropica TaxID=450798 RepID=A0ABN2SRD1_9ACTN
MSITSFCSSRTRARFRALAFAALGCAFAVSAAHNAAPAAAADRAPAAPAVPSLKGLRYTGQYTIDSQSQAQGLATVFGPHGRSSLYYSGNTSIPDSVRAAGWPHVGDPDSSAGLVFDAYQGTAADSAKMFRVTLPSGAAYNYVHPLAPGEEMNNSFAAVSPNGQWMVAGEWDTMTRLLVFPTPVLNRATAPAGGELPLAATIELDHPVQDIQGCTFADATRLLCASDANDTALWPTVKPLLQIDLRHKLDGTTVTGHVTTLGALPLISACAGQPADFESEGVDFDRRTGTFRVEMIPPAGCDSRTTVYEYQATRR